MSLLTESKVITVYGDDAQAISNGDYFRAVVESREGHKVARLEKVA